MLNTICFFNTVRFWGGGEKFYLDYARGFKKKGYTIYMVCDKNSALAEKAQALALPCFFIRVSMFSALNPFKVRRLVRFFRKEKIDTVLFSTSQDRKLAAFTSYIAGVRNIIYRRGLAVPIKNGFINRIIFRDILTHILANSQETKRTILLNLSGVIPPEKIKVIYNGTEVDENTMKERDPMELIVRKSRGVVLGNAGRLTAQKGQKLLLDMAGYLKEEGVDFTLFIAGTGELRTELEAKIRDCGLQDHVFLTGFVEDIGHFMQSIDIFLLSSVWEGFGYVLVEAMLQSKPVICFNITSNPEIVLDNTTGFLVDYPDMKEFARKVKLLAENKELREKLGKAGRKSVLERFLLKDRITELEQYLSDLEVPAG